MSLWRQKKGAHWRVQLYNGFLYNIIKQKNKNEHCENLFEEVDFSNKKNSFDELSEVMNIVFDS